jgi:hypothetical protein
MKKIYALLTFIAFTTTVMAQTKGITYQAVLYDPAYKNQSLPGVDNMLIPYANKSVCLRFQITDKNNQAIYIETQSTKTDPFGMVNLIIGQGNKIGGLVSSFDTINWNTQANSLIVSLDNSGNCSDFKEATNQPFTASPFALGNTSINTADYELIANKSNNISVDANSTTKYPSVNAIKSYVDSKVGTIPDGDAITKGKIQLAGDLAGTAAVPTVPGLALKVEKEAGKGLSSNDYTTAEKTKLGAISGTNTGDQDLSSYATITALANKVDKEAGKGLSSNDYTTAEKTKLGAISGTNTGDQDLTGYATVIALGSKQDVSNISNTIVADASSTTKYPSVKGIKDYVDGLNNAGGVADGSITSLKIADNAIVNADVSPTAAIDFVKLNISKSNILGLGIVKSDIGLSNVDNTSDALKPISDATQAALNTKVDKETGKGLSSNDYTTAEKTKLGAITGTNTGDQDLTGYATVTALDAKVVDRITDAVTTSAPTQNAVFDALALKANTSDVTTSLGLKEDAANKSNDTNLGSSSTLFPTQNAVKTYVDAAVAGTTLTGTAPIKVTTGVISLNDEGVTTPKLADNAVTIAKLPIGATATTFLQGDGTWANQNAINTPSTAITETITQVAVPSTEVQGAISDLATAVKTAANNNIYGSDGTLTGNRIVNQGANSLNFAGDGTTSFNKVSIGTTQSFPDYPTAKLVIADKDENYNTDILQVASAFGNPTHYFASSRGTIQNPTAIQNYDQLGSLIFQGHDGTSYNNSVGIYADVFGNTSTGIIPGSLSFATKSEQGLYAIRMLISSNGNIGIGTYYTPPTNRLTVNGGINAFGNEAISNEGLHLQWNREVGVGESWIINQKGSSSSPNSGIRFGSASQTNDITEWARFIDNGNLGIGTTAPTAQFHTTGSVLFAGAGTPGVGKVLTSDATGLATWQTLSIPTITGSTPIDVTSGVVSLNDAGVTTPKLANNAVTIAKLPTGATATTFLRGDGSWASPAFKGLVSCAGTLTQVIADANVSATSSIFVSYEDTTGDIIYTSIKSRVAGTGFTVQFGALPSTSAKINYIIVP